MARHANIFSTADLLRRAAAYYPQKTFLVFDGRRISYAELDRRANRLSNGLRSLGLTKGDHVAVLFRNGPQCAECFFAVAKAGGVAVPLNTRLSARELAYMIDNSDCKMLVYSAQFSETVAEVRPGVSGVNRFIADGETPPSDTVNYEALMAGSGDKDPNVEVGLADDCLILYTAGTTGFPKGAVRNNSTTVTAAHVTALMYSLRSDDVTFAIAPWFHVGGWVTQVLPAVVRAGTVVTAESFRPAEVLRALQDEKVTVIFLVPAMSVMLLNLPDIDRHDLGHVRVFTSGGAPTPEELKRRIRKHFPNAGYYDVYGMTETTGITYCPPEDALRKEMCAGIPLSNVRVRLADDKERDVPQGQIGEVLVRSTALFSRYYKDPKNTSESMKGRWFHTGDLGRMDEEGYLYLVDRKKDFIISGGENVYCAEVENVIFEHPKVREAAVIGLQDKAWGERVVAVVRLGDGEELTEQELIDFCRQRIAHYKAPKEVICLKEPLPRTSFGKVLKRDLRARFGG